MAGSVRLIHRLQARVPDDPGSWNRYSYTRGDPINRLDPRGLEDCPPGVDFCVTGTAVADSPDPSPCSEFAVMAPWAAAYLSSIGACGVPYSSETQAGGGGGPTGPRLMTESYENLILDRAFGIAKTMLQTPSCERLFNVGGAAVDPTSLLEDLVAGTTVAGSIVFGTVQPGAIASTTKFVNADFSPGVVITLDNLAFGNFALETAVQQAGTLLHELGHAYADIFGQNTTLIRNNDNPLFPDGTPNRVGARNQAFNQNAINTQCPTP